MHCAGVQCCASSTNATAYTRARHTSFSTLFPLLTANCRRVGHGGGHGGVVAAVHWTLGLTLASLLPSSVLSPGPGDDGDDGDDGDSSPAPRLAAQSLSSLLSVTVCCFYRHLTLFSL